MTEPPPLFFVCNDSTSKDFLGDCQTFKNFAKERKWGVVVDAGRFLNGFSLGHIVKTAWPLRDVAGAVQHVAGSTLAC